MSGHDIARLAFVLAGIYALFQALEHFGGGFWWLSISDTTLTQMGMTRLQMIAASLFPGILITLTGIVLIISNARLARWMFPDAQPSPERMLGFPGLAYSVVGMVSFIWGLSSIASPIITLSSGLAGQALAELLECAVLILLGVGLFFGSHGLARIWSRLRYAGLRRQMGLCARCGYDLMGNTSGICPECGTPTSAPAPQPPRVLLSDEEMRAEQDE